MNILSKINSWPIRISLFLGCWLGGSNILVACDVCGCAASGSGLGVLPRFDSGFLGLRYGYQGFAIPSPQRFSGIGPGTDGYHRIEIWSRIPLNSRLQIIGSLPYSINERLLDEGASTRIAGIGDLQILLNAALWRFETETYSIQWNAAMGVRLPTGRYRQRDENGSMLPIGLQTGTGAYGFPVASQIGLRKGNWGGMFEAAAVLSTENEETFQVGTAWSTAVNALHYADFKKRFLISHIGLRLEGAERDREFDQTLQNTGFTRAALVGGSDYYFGAWMLGARLGAPIWTEAPESQSQWNWSASIHGVWFWERPKDEG